MVSRRKQAEMEKRESKKQDMRYEGPWMFEHLDELMRERNTNRLTLAYNTVAERTADANILTIKLFGVGVMHLAPSNVAIHRHGYATTTTQRRINRCLQSFGKRVVVRGGEDDWYVLDVLTGEREKFYDGIVISVQDIPHSEVSAG